MRAVATQTMQITRRANSAGARWFAPVAMAHSAVSHTLGTLCTKKINPRAVSGGLPMEGIP